jgi:HK97 family phage portal protein
MGLWRDYLNLFRRDAAPVRPTMVGVVTAGGLIPGVTATTSLGLSAVWRSLDILSNGVSQLPWREMRGNLELPPSRLVSRPLAAATRREWVSIIVSTLALYDVAYCLRVGGYDSEGVPLGLAPLNPDQVMATSIDATSVLALSSPDEYFVGRSKVTRDELVILRRSPQPGISDSVTGVLKLARVMFAAAIAAEHYASRYWQAGGPPTVALETDAHLNQTEADEISGRWAERRGKGPDYAPVLSGGVKAKPFGADPTAEAAIEARREMVADVGRYFGMPTRMLNAPAGDTETYTSTESANLDLIRFTLQNYIGAIEDAISDELPGGRRMEMDIGRLSMGTQLARAQAWQLALGGSPWMIPDEVREAEKLPPQEMPAPTPAAVTQGVGP